MYTPSNNSITTMKSSHTQRSLNSNPFNLNRPEDGNYYMHKLQLSGTYYTSPTL
uniref:Uncharacterized protein n=1 Tax=Anguilla anguilla TaxID=7936 RepID=A0A0E9XQS8_ANGAN